MQRIIRTFGVVVVLGALLALTPVGQAQEGHEAPEETHSTSQETHAAGQEGHGAGGHEVDAGMQAAEKLAVEAPPSWYSKVIIGSVVLFVLAATLGSVAVLTKAPEPQEPDHHDDHGHDHGGHGHH